VGGHDTTVLGQEPLSAKQRFDRYAEFVELSDRLLVQDRTTYSGEYYQAVDARSTPGSVRRPRVPFALAGNGPRALGLVAQFGQGWVTTGTRTDDEDEWWRGVGQLSARLDDALTAANRNPGGIDRYLSLDASPRYSLTSVTCFTDLLGRAQQLGFTDVVVHWPRSEGVYAGQESVIEQIAADVLPGLEPAPKRDRWRSTT